jgi:ribosomal protein S18 acetylase RimI-like enzyme
VSAIEAGAMKVRRMTPGDLDEVLGLISRMTKGKPRITYRDLIANGPGGPLDLSLVAEANGQMVGFILARVEFVYIPLVEVCLIYSVGVDPQYRSRHIGAALVNELIRYCRLQDIPTVRALVVEDNEPLRKFIEYLGFGRSNVINYDKSTY